MLHKKWCVSIVRTQKKNKSGAREYKEKWNKETKEKITVKENKKGIKKKKPKKKEETVQELLGICSFAELCSLLYWYIQTNRWAFFSFFGCVTVSRSFVFFKGPLLSLSFFLSFFLFWVILFKKTKKNQVIQ